MPATVPDRATTLTRDAVVSGLPVTGATWDACAKQYNHIAGMATSLVPLYAPDVTVAAAGTGTFRFTVFSRYQAGHRLWVICVGTASGYADCTLTYDSGPSVTFRADVNTGAGCMRFVETLTGGDRSDVEHPIDVTLAVSAGSTGSAIVRVLGCFELPRAELAPYPSLDAGVSAETLRAGLPIYDGVLTNRSLGGLTGWIDTALITARRTGFFAASPYFTTTSGVLVAAGYARGFVVRARKLYRTSTTGLMQVRAYCRTPVGTTGEIVFTMTSGDVATLTIPSNSGGWITGNVDIDCDDFSDAYGRRSSRFDKCVVTARRTGGAGTVSIDHYCGGEA